MGRKYHYWIVASQDNRPVLIYGADNENAARQRGLEMLAGVDFTLKRLPTSNLARASSLLKGNRLEQTHSLREATEHLTHERGLRRKKIREHRRSQ